MGNLFLVFDPATPLLGSTSLNWLSTAAFLLLPSGFWLSRSKMEVLIKKSMESLHEEVKMNANLPLASSISLMLCSVLGLVLTNNFLGLLPYVFTASSHPAFTFVLAASSWVGYMVYSLSLNPSNFFSHLVPSGTPNLLIPFMVLIELVSSVIRPLTLGVRLAANMVAGHLLLVLVSGPIPSLSAGVAGLALVGVLSLMVLEVGVSFIQGYVFMSLSSLYVGEVNASNL